jgi:hypothetical protein
LAASQINLAEEAQLSYPPYPKPILFLGNALQFPDAKKEANLDAKFLQWAMD